MYEIKSDSVKNRIYLKLAGFLSDEEVHDAAEKFKAEVRKLKPGIDVINDISDFRPATANGAAIIKDAQKFLAEYGMNRLVRVVDQRVSGLLQFKTMGHQAGIDGLMAHTLEEAEKSLDKEESIDD